MHEFIESISVLNRSLFNSIGQCVVHRRDGLITCIWCLYCLARGFIDSLKRAIQIQHPVHRIVQFALRKILIEPRRFT